MENSFCLENATEEVNFTIHCNPIDTRADSARWFLNNTNMVHEIVYNETDILRIEDRDSTSALRFGPATLMDIGELLQFSNMSSENISIVIGCTLTNEFGNDTKSIEITQCGKLCTL